MTGHWREGANTNHFFGLCEECDAHAVQGMSLDDVERRFRSGHLSQDKLDGYRWAWMTSSFKFGTFPDSWSVAPASVPALNFGELVKAIAAERKSVREEEC
jgi:hypothetical protein